jgi:hypothetical protein
LNVAKIAHLRLLVASSVQACGPQVQLEWQQGWRKSPVGLANEESHASMRNEKPVKPELSQAEG